MKKVLLISYYWPPAGGAGVQRWLKMSKYLPENGWKPVVYTAIPSQYVSEDQSLMSEIHPDIEEVKIPISEPYELYQKFTGKSKKQSNFGGLISDGKGGLAQKASIFIRSNFFIPDARKWWIRPSIKFLKSWLKENHVDIIVSTGPPHSMHMIALGIKRLFPDIPWVADFRDPWTNIDFYKDLNLMGFADRKHHRQEKQVLQTADRVVAVTWDMAREFEVLSEGRKIDVILNGYDPADFSNFQNEKTDKFIICHLGSMNKDRNPDNLWKSIAELLINNPDLASKLEIHLIGSVDFSVNQSISKFGLKDNVRFMTFMPHDEAIDYLQKCDILLLSINNSANSKGILPTKMYEYMASKKPILAIGPKDGDIARVLKTMGHCKLSDYNAEDISEFILAVYEQSPIASAEILKYSRQSQAASYAKLLEELC